MKFIDKEHEKFWKVNILLLQEYGKENSYYKALIYTLGICETTRNNFNKICNLRKGEINIDSINAKYQTSTSSKVTRMAFSLFNGCNYDSEKDIENGKISPNYNVSDIFCCGYAPYFFEAIKIKYPEYCRESAIKEDFEKKLKDIIRAEEIKVRSEKMKRARELKKERER